MEVLVNNDIDNVEGEKVAIITGDIPISCMCVSRCCLFCVCPVSRRLCEPDLILQHEYEGPTWEDIQVLYRDSSL